MELDIEKEIESITTQLIEKYCPEKIILFGSAAQGDRDQVNDCLFRASRPPIPEDSGRLFQSIAAICSGHSGHPLIGAKRRWYLLFPKVFLFSQV